jgi:hypothetical protein
MGDVVFWIAGIGWSIVVGMSAFRMFRTGELRIGNLGGPPTIIQRRLQPRRFWAFVCFCYVVLTGIIATAAYALYEAYQHMQKT